ncbi:hypothetical protein HOH87_00620 [bacterium]|jgi:hypothetical protein|nr:hypothetical protein [bacterium]
MNIKSSFGLVVVIVGLLLGSSGAYADSVTRSISNREYLISNGVYQIVDPGISISASSMTEFTVEISPYNAAEDFLGFVPIANSTTTAIHPDGSGVNTFTITLDSGLPVTVAQFEQVMRSIHYKNLNTNPGNLSRTLIYSVGAASTSIDINMRYLTVEATSDSNGTISPSGVSDQLYLGSPSYSMTPSAGFYLRNVQVTHSDASSTSYGIINPFQFGVDDNLFGDHIIHAEFSPFSSITTSVSDGVYIRGTGNKVVDPGIVVSSDSLDGAKVSIVGFIAGDFLSFTPRGGISGAYNGSDGILSLTGTGTAAQYQAVLRSVAYQNNSATLVPQTREFVFSLGRMDVNPDNGHFYEFVDKGSPISWTAAVAEADLKAYFGMQGYLTTVTTETENLFIKDKLGGVGWMGGSDAVVEGEWRWDSGPESGIQFSVQSLTGGCTANTGSSFNSSYTNWHDGNPDNCSSSEHYAYMLSSGKWNDITESHGTLKSYVVEYGGMAGDPPNILTASVVYEVTNYHVTANSGFNGSITNGGFTFFQANQDVAVFHVTGASSLHTMTPIPNFQVAEIIVDGAPQGAADSFTFDDIQADHTISVTFENIMHTITATMSGDGQGTISSPGATTYRQSFDSASYTIASDSNMFFITDVIVDGVSQGQVDFFDFGAVMGPHTIEAVISTRPQLDSNFFGTGF